jgi:hypothetical protein
LVKELNFARGLDENPYKYLQDFEEICATLTISGMNNETLKWKAFPFSLTGWVKQWYKLHASSCHGSWVILKDKFYFILFPLPKIIDLRNEESGGYQHDKTGWRLTGRLCPRSMQL